MEEKLDGLMALLAARQTGKEASPSDSPSAPSLPTSGVSPPAMDLQAFTHPVSSSVSSISFSRSDISRPQQLLPIFSFPNYDSFNDAISKGIVTYSQAEAFIPYFQSRAPSFPFVLVPPKMTIDALRRERPVLLLAVLTAAANRNCKLQTRLELELRETLSKKILVDCEKSIDVLQGLLVYLAYYHLFFEPQREQMYQLSQMAGAMAVDLGINKSSQDTVATDVRLVKARLFFPNSPEELEAQRTFLGCYFLTTA
jgi:hypothetical protein